MKTKAVDKDLAWLVEDLAEDTHTLLARFWVDLSRWDRVVLAGRVASLLVRDHLEARRVVRDARGFTASRRGHLRARFRAPWGIT